MMAGDRNGKAHLAVSLGNFTVQPRLEVNLLNELDYWLNQFQRTCGEKGTPARYRRELRAIEEAMFDFCRYGVALRMQNILIALGNASQAISLLALSKEKFEIKPLRLRCADRWLEALDDNSPEFRIAAAIASISGDGEGHVGSIRENIEPVVWDNKKKEYIWKDNTFNVFLTDLPRGLAEVLEKRMVAANKHNLDRLPLNSKLTATVADVHGYLRGELDEVRILALLKGLVLLDYRDVKGKVHTLSDRQGEVPAAFSILKLIFLPHPFSWPKGSESVSIRPEQTVLSRLRGQDVSGAAKIALRRLRSSGFALKLSTVGADRLVVSPDLARRIAGALLIPVYDWRRLADFALVKPDNTERSWI
jgi:CRISPR-associated protein Csx17